MPRERLQRLVAHYQHELRNEESIIQQPLRHRDSGFELNETDWTTVRPGNSTQQVVDKCGFCKDGTACVCVDKVLPGDCDACRADPEKAAACREIAANGNVSAGSTQAQGPSVSCSSFVDQLNANGVMDEAQLLRGLQMQQVETGGYEINEQQAAEALQMLQKSKVGSA